jgi:hypothetical protein
MAPQPWSKFSLVRRPVLTHVRRGGLFSTRVPARTRGVASPGNVVVNVGSDVCARAVPNPLPMKESCWSRSGARNPVRAQANEPEVGRRTLGWRGAQVCPSEWRTDALSTSLTCMRSAPQPQSKFSLVQRPVSTHVRRRGLFSTRVPARTRSVAQSAGQRANVPTSPSISIRMSVRGRQLCSRGRQKSNPPRSRLRTTRQPFCRSPGRSRGSAVGQCPLTASSADALFSQVRRSMSRGRIRTWSKP